MHRPPPPHRASDASDGCADSRRGGNDVSGLDLLIPQSALWYMLLVATVSGVLLGVLCDGLFILRLLLRDPRASSAMGKAPPHVQTNAAEVPLSPDTADAPSAQTHQSPRLRAWGYAVLQGFCDLVSVLTATVILMLLCYYTSDGQLRAPAVFGMIAGFWGYHKTVSRLFRRLTATLLEWIFQALRFLWSHTFGRLLGYLFGAAVGRVRRVATTRRIARLTHEAAQGFGISENPSNEQDF